MTINVGCFAMHVPVDTVQGSSAVQDVQHVRTWMTVWISTRISEKGSTLRKEASERTRCPAPRLRDSRGLLLMQLAGKAGTASCNRRPQRAQVPGRAGP